jgi:hypothetical protein
MFASSVLYAKEKKEVPGSAIFVMAMPKEMIVQGKNIIYTDENVKITMEIPQIQGLGDKKFQKLTNRYFQKEAMRIKKQIAKEAKQAQTKVPYELISYFTIKETPKSLLSIENFRFIYKGGGSGFVTTQFITIDKQKNRIITLKDFFKKDKMLEHKINTYLKEHFLNNQVQKVAFMKEVDEIRQVYKVDERQNFYINQEGAMILVFNLCEIENCQESGSIKLEIPRHIFSFW